MLIIRSTQADHCEDVIQNVKAEDFVCHGSTENVFKVTASGKALRVVCQEIDNIPMPKAKNMHNYDAISWYGDDAKFIVANFRDMYIAYTKN